jgi:hypothetical protein
MKNLCLPDCTYAMYNSPSSRQGTTYFSNTHLQSCVGNVCALLSILQAHQVRIHELTVSLKQAIGQPFS